MAEDVFGIVGTTQGPYRVESVVAEGGFGVVYRAHHDAFRAPVALKCLKVPGKLSEKDQADFLERFREEAEVMFRLSASIPAVVRPLHVDVIVTSTGQFVPFMALEWLEGETLDKLVARRTAEGRPPLTLKRLVRMLTPVARALERAHHFPGPDGTVSIVHCDLKPDNIFLLEQDGIASAKILDFGIAKVRSAASRMAGRMSQHQGGNSFTPGYAAPEQWLPKRYGQAGPWTDVWGMAITLVEAAVGRPVIDGDHAGMMGTATDEKRRPTPRAEGLTVSDEVEEIFVRALAVDPRHRQHDVGLFWDELERAFGLEGTANAAVRRDSRSDGGGAIREERVELGRKSYSSLVPPPMTGTPTLPSYGQAPVPSPPPSASSIFAAPTMTAARPNPSVASMPAVSPTYPAAAPMPPSMPSSPRVGMTTAERRVTAAPLSPNHVVPQGLSFGGEVELHEDDPGQHIALDLDPLHAAPISSHGNFRPRPAASTQVRDFPVRPGSSGPDLKSRLASPLRLALVGIGIGAAERLYIELLGGEPIALGPIRLIWLASAVALVGIVLVLFRLFWPTEE